MILASNAFQGESIVSRLLLAALLAGATLTGLGASANAAVSSAPIPMTAHTPMAHVVQVDMHCGRGRHFVRRHRRHGHWVRGYCARNHRFGHH
jgi:hypothetical protein